MLTSSADNTAHIWEASTGNELARKSNVDSAAFSPDGKYVLSGFGSIFSVWYWQNKDLIARACDYMPRNLTPAEWQQYICDALPYATKQEEANYANLPIELEVTSTPTVTP